MLVAVGALVFVAGFFTAMLLKERGKGLFPSHPFPSAHTRTFTLPLNNPSAVSAKSAHHMRDQDLIFGVVVNGHARAYPRWIMLQYHVANDTIDNIPLLLSQCEVCSSASAFTPVLRGLPYESLTFMVCGKNHGTFSICDNQTISLWQPFTGVAFKGPLKGRRLSRIPVVTQSWKNWKSAHPNTDVILAAENLKQREHSEHKTPPGDPFIPYYFEADANLSDKRLAPNALVYGIYTAADKGFVVPLNSLKKFKVTRREVLGTRYVLVKYDNFAVAAFLAPENEAEYKVVKQKPFVLGDGHGGLWNEFGFSLPESKVRKNLSLADGRLTEWYEWISDCPQSEVIDAKSGLPIH